jgi:hypothetical protein
MDTATLKRVVHARQIVEDQRCRVEVFERDCQLFGRGLLKTVRLSHLKDHPRADEAAGIVKHVPQCFFE